MIAQLEMCQNHPHECNLMASANYGSLWLTVHNLFVLNSAHTQEAYYAVPQPNKMPNFGQKCVHPQARKQPMHTSCQIAFNSKAAAWSVLRVGQCCIFVVSVGSGILTCNLALELTQEIHLLCS